MKRAYFALLSFVFVIAVIMTSFGSVNAKPLQDGSANLGVSWVSGDKTYTVESIPVVNLPGTTIIKSGMIVPVGFNINGEKQFEGLGLQISGLESGKLTACFTISAINQGWGGSVARWTGTKWELMSTQITTPEETGHSIACSAITSNGVYALLKWVVDPSKLASTGTGCGYNILNTYGTTPDGYEATDHGGIYMTGIYDHWMIQSNTVLTGKHVTVTVLSTSPANFYAIGNVSGTLSWNGGNYYAIELSPTVDFTQYYSLASVTFLLDFGSCKQEITVTAV